jgi:hypothetical protein
MPGVKISVTRKGSVYFYVIEDVDHRIEFSLSEHLFETLRALEEKARHQNEEPPESPARLGVV